MSNTQSTFECPNGHKYAASPVTPGTEPLSCPACGMMPSTYWMSPSVGSSLAIPANYVFTGGVIANAAIVSRSPLLCIWQDKEQGFPIGKRLEEVIDQQGDEYSKQLLAMIRELRAEIASIRDERRSE